MTTESIFRRKALRWINAYSQLVNGEEFVKCPVCGLGNLKKEITDENPNEIRVFCDHDLSHEAFFLYSETIST